MRRRSRISDFAAGAIALAVIVVACYIGFTKSIPFRSHYEIKAAFSSANGIKSSSPVRIAGVEVGRVSKVEPMDDGKPAALVTMRIKDDGRPVHRDAQAKIRPRIFLEGNFFVDLSPGTPSAPELEDGGVIPIERTSVPVQLDQVLKALPAETRADLRTALKELFRTYEDGGAEAFNRSLEFQPDAYRFSAIVNEALLGRNPHDLSDWIRDQGTVSAALNRTPEQLRSLVTDFNRTAGALASEQGALQAAVAELPRTLRAAAPTLDALNAAFPDVRRLAVEALPGIRSTVPTLDELQPLVVQLRGLVSRSELRGLSADLRAATPPLTQVARTTVPLLEQLRQMGSCANQVLIPTGEDKIEDKAFPANGPTHTELFKSLVGLAGESRSHDANSQWFKVLGSGGLETFQFGRGRVGSSGSATLGVNPPKFKGRPALRADVPCETQEPPDLRTTPGQLASSGRANPNSAAVRERTAKARAVAIEVLQRQLDAELGAKAPKVLDRDAKVSDLVKASGR